MSGLIRDRTERLAVPEPVRIRLRQRPTYSLGEGQP